MSDFWEERSKKLAAMAVERQRKSRRFFRRCLAVGVAALVGTGVMIWAVDRSDTREQAERQQRCREGGGVVLPTSSGCDSEAWYCALPNVDSHRATPDSAER